MCSFLGKISLCLPVCTVHLVLPQVPAWDYWTNILTKCNSINFRRIQRPGENGLLLKSKCFQLKMKPCTESIKTNHWCSGWFTEADSWFLMRSFVFTYFLVLFLVDLSDPEWLSSQVLERFRERLTGSSIILNWICMSLKSAKTSYPKVYLNWSVSLL